jgi:hypothetical protein
VECKSENAKCKSENEDSWAVEFLIHFAFSLLHFSFCIRRLIPFMPAHASSRLSFARPRNSLLASAFWQP